MDINTMPKVEIHEGVYVVRDDLLEGGTKTRYIMNLFDKHDEIVYTTPAYGVAQVALAYCAKVKNKKATLFVAKRKDMHRRTKKAQDYGANVVEIPYGYMSVLNARARDYCKNTNAYLLKLGAYEQGTIDKIGEIAKLVNSAYGDFDEVWCATGSGTLLKGLQKGLNSKSFYGVQVGKNVENNNATILKYDKPFSYESKFETPFPSCPNYDKKAWEICLKNKGEGKILFWNVAGDI